MKKATKYFSIFFAALLMIPVFSVGLSAHENEISNYHEDNGNISRVSNDLTEKADKYVILKDGKFVYIENSVLTFTEVAEIKASIKETNEMIDRAKELNQYIHFQSDKSVRISKDEISTQAEGFTGLDTYWWGFRAWISKNDINGVCIMGITAIIRTLGIWYPVLLQPVVEALASFLISGFCGIVFQSGVWIDWNYALGPQGSGW